MKKIFEPKRLPLLTAVLAGMALVLRALLYLVAVDKRGLLISGHPLNLALYGLTVAAMVYLLVTVWKLDGSAAYEDNFAPSRNAMLGHFAAAAGVAVTVLTRYPLMDGYLGQLWQWLGYLTPVCLLLSGIDRGQGRQPFFLLHMIPSLFFVFHIVNHYQVWSGDPQLQDYGFALLGGMALALFAYYTAGFDVGMGQRRMQLFMAMAAVYLLAAELATTGYPWLLLGGIAWAMTDICTLTPKPKPEPEEREEKET